MNNIHKKTKYHFSPNPELLKFANEFSENYKSLRTGEYFSDNNKYHIIYSKKIKDTNTCARISQETGIIEIDKTKFNNKAYTPDFMFFIILWCTAIRYVGDVELIDKAVIEYYLTTGRSKKNLIQGQAQMLDTRTGTDVYKTKPYGSKII